VVWRIFLTRIWFGADVKLAILVIDDDVLSLELYSRELSNNYTVITGESVEEAHRLLKSHAISVVIIEPTVNGDEGWTLIKEIRASPNPPVVIICSVVEDRKAGFEQGADAFVVKPVLPTALHRLIDQILSRKKISSAQGMDKGT
jgi:two-component system, NtrC family, response regulator GlrR